MVGYRTDCELLESQARTDFFLGEVILRREIPERSFLGVMNCHRLYASQQHILGDLATQAVEP